MSAFGTVGILHPGEMGSGVAFAAHAGASRVAWASAGRSPATRTRAQTADLVDLATLPALIREAEALVSVCPPAAARDVARAVAATGFRGLYIDVNAIAPATAREVCAIVENAGATFVDGGIVGASPRKPGLAVLYLAGAQAARAAAIWDGGPLETHIVDGPIGAASAAKVCYAAWTKGSTALLLAIRALARSEGVDETLLWQWARSNDGSQEKSERGLSGSAHKAWRWIGEMHEIASAFEAHGLPGEFHKGAAKVYEALERYKDTNTPPTMDEATRALLRRP